MKSLKRFICLNGRPSFYQQIKWTVFGLWCVFSQFPEVYTYSSWYWGFKYDIASLKFTLFVRQCMKSDFMSVTETRSWGRLGPLTHDTTVDRSRETTRVNTGSCASSEKLRSICAAFRYASIACTLLSSRSVTNSNSCAWMYSEHVYNAQGIHNKRTLFAQ